MDEKTEVANTSQEKISPPSKDSSPEEIFDLIVKLVDEKSLSEFYNQLLEPPSPRETTSTIIDFLTSKETQEAIKRQWQRQRDPVKWPNRSGYEAFAETLDYIFIDLDLKAANKFMDLNKEGLPEEEISKADREYTSTHKRIGLIQRYLNRQRKARIKPPLG